LYARHISQREAAAACGHNRVWLESGRLIGEGRYLGQSGDVESLPVVEYAAFGATDHDVDVEGLVTEILDHVFDKTQAGCECARLRVAVYLVPEGEDQVTAFLAFRHSRPECPTISADD
jgi:hypothetical protein